MDSTERRYGRLDRWWDSDRIGPETARGMADRIELRARAADEVAARRAYLDLLAPRPGQRVLEVGCGTGAVLRDLAPRVAPGGRAVGLEYSPAILAIARELAAEAGLLDLIELRPGDARRLPFADGEFDLALAATALSHIPDAERAVPELVRVVRSGGTVAVFDRDTDSYVINHPDRALTRRIVASYSDHGQTDGWLIRRMPGLMAAAGVREIGVRAFTSLEREPDGFYGVNCLRAAEVALQTGEVSRAEHDRWLAELRAEQAAGRFLAGMTQILVWGRRPARDGGARPA